MTGTSAGTGFPFTSKCLECGRSSREVTLVGRRGDRRRDGERWCFPHHPESLAGTLADLTVVGS